jgi:hypothetical protein
MGGAASISTVDRFIARWIASSGQERANFQLFAAELCDLLGAARCQAVLSSVEHKNDTRSAVVAERVFNKWSVSRLGVAQPAPSNAYALLAISDRSSVRYAGIHNVTFSPLQGESACWYGASILGRPPLVLQ